MTPRATLFSALLLTGLVASAQNNLFSTSTTAPAQKPAGTPQPIQVHSDGPGTFSLKDEFALYKVNVRVNDPQFFLRCESLRLDLDLKATKGTNQPIAGAQSPTNSPLTAPMGGRVRAVEALGNVTFSNKVDFSQAYAERIIYQATNDAFELTGSARVIKGTITNWADKILFQRAKGQFDFSGNVRTEGTYTPATTNSAPKKP